MSATASLPATALPDTDEVVAFVGGGQMASALITGLVRSGWNARSIVVVEPNAYQRARLEQSLAVKALSAADASLAQARMVVWAVKPQVLFAAAQPVIEHLRSPLHVSIAAGIATDALTKWLKTDRVIRVMPNTSALVGQGVSGMFGTPGVTTADRRLTEELFSATGRTFWVDSDERIDAVTALSGSGPGYVFQFLVAFEAAAQGVGFSPEQARELVLYTAAGAVAQAVHDDTPFSTLRDRVTSKGGTTAAGMEALDRKDFSGAMSDAVRAAYGRARELSASLAKTQENT